MHFSNSEKNRLKTKYGPWAFVTGASSGIGLELAERIAEAGINLVLTARRKDVLVDIASRLTARHGVQIEVLAADLSKPEDVGHILSSIAHVEIGLFIASAGFGTSGYFKDGNLPEELNMLEVNCNSLMRMTHHFCGYFASKRRGGIVLISSIVGFQGVPYAAHYAATKAYVQSLAEALAVEMKGFGVDVLAAAPGPVHTGFEARANMRQSGALTPQQVGVPILKALGRKQTVLPGWLTKVLVYSLRTAPRWGKVRIMALVMGGMTKHQRS